MTLTHILLQSLQEELAQIISVVSKCVILGPMTKTLDEMEAPTNIERLVVELNVFAALLEVMQREGVLTRHWRDQEAMQFAIRRIYAILLTAKDDGRLEPCKLKVP